VDILLFILEGITVLALLGALARVIGADSRESIDDTRAERTVRTNV
jgi:hypothetical protein